MIRLRDKEGRNIIVSPFGAADVVSLYLFYQLLSPASRSRFAPHSFQYAALQEMGESPDPAYLRFVVREEGAEPLIAYFIFYRGLFEWEQKRFISHGVQLSPSATCTFAPALSDRWQGRGLGSLLFLELEKQVKSAGFTHIVLWGGVQQQNERAVSYYERHGFKRLGRFWYEGKENLDMMKEL